MATANGYRSNLKLSTERHPQRRSNGSRSSRGTLLGERAARLPRRAAQALRDDIFQREDDFLERRGKMICHFPEIEIV
jgi:hypothetical protein